MKLLKKKQKFQVKHYVNGKNMLDVMIVKIKWFQVNLDNC